MKAGEKQVCSGAVEKTKKLYSGESEFAMPVGVLHQDISES